MIFQRSFHSTRSCLTVTKSSILAKLRKSTGYPLSNCKKALQLFPDNVEKAEEWLHAEAKSKGWSKWAKIQTRTAAQGLIGVCSKDNVGVMLEVNCETDFVSRNAEFQQLVERMLSGCINYAANLNTQAEITKEVLEESHLNSIQCETSSLGELVVAATMKFNEKTVAKRAICLKVPDDVLLNSLSHPATICSSLNGASLGKYGVLLASRKKEVDNTTEDINLLENRTKDTHSLRINMCNHIIGMNPLSIGQLTEKDVAKFSAQSSSKELEVCENIQCEQSGEQVKPKTEAVAQSEQSGQQDSSGDPEMEELQEEEVGLKESNETQLLFQFYLMDPSVTVGESLYKAGVEVVAFERFECGETAENSNLQQDVAVAATA